MESQTSRRRINLVYFLFWTSLYQLICVGLLFWLDILPWYGNVDNISEFAKKYVSSFNICFVPSFVKETNIYSGSFLKTHRSHSGSHKPE